ncbi:MAG: hypothetical protein KF774_03015 [Planctomyces sp.]|nr:hypothetical protein [Planctomyces sp.]
MEYQFRPLGKVCAATGRPLEPGEDCLSALVERDGVVSRLDFSLAGWTGPPPGTIGVWRCQTPAAMEVNAARVDPELLLQLFEQLVETANPAHDRRLYVLALYLLQRRRLRLEGTRDDEDEVGGPMLELTGSRGEGPYLIRDQQLPEEEIRNAQAELNRQLSEHLLAADAA